MDETVGRARALVADDDPTEPLRFEAFFEARYESLFRALWLVTPASRSSRYQIWIASGITSSTGAVPEGDAALIPEPTGPLPAI